MKKDMVKVNDGTENGHSIKKHKLILIYFTSP